MKFQNMNSSSFNFIIADNILIAETQDDIGGFNAANVITIVSEVVSRQKVSGKQKKR
jgi:hypothetical protein